MSQAIKYIYINLNVRYGNETIKFVITTKFLGVHIGNIIIIIYYIFKIFQIMALLFNYCLIQINCDYTYVCHICYM